MMTIIFYLFTYIVFSTAFLYNKYDEGLGLPFVSKLENTILPKEEFFSQKLDHFNPTDEIVWPQRYWSNAAFYKPSGPVFLMINGEAPASALWITVGRWISYAEENDAMCFLLEHRFYGNSHPKNDTSTENLMYLSSEQALADAAYFIKGMNAKYSLSNSPKWIVFGGSYAGSLAAWLRLKYPHLVYGAVSSSGPLLAKLDFFEYYQVVRDSLSSYDANCVEEVKNANEQLDVLIRNVVGRSVISKMFKLCSTLKNNKDDISSLFENLADNFAGVVQYNKDNRMSDTNSLTIDVLCNVMSGGQSKMKNSSPIIRYAKVNKLLLNKYNNTCVSYKYEDSIQSLRKIDWENASNAGRQWFYQTCTEFGFYQTSSKSSDIFGRHFPSQYFINQCKNVFGSRFNESLLKNAISRTNIIYGALDINIGNIIYVHGSVDPWHALGILNTKNSKLYQAIFINGTAHCADTYPASDKDSEELKFAVIKIRNIIRSWLRKI